MEVLCPICFNLFDDPVTWPAPSCEEKHNFCRGCLFLMCDSKELKSLCPICRAQSTVPILDQLWTLPVDPVLNARIAAEYPEHHALSMAKRERKQREYESLPRTTLPIFVNFERQVGFDCSSLHRGKVVDFRIFEPAHALLLATCFANPETTRFGLLLAGETWGYIAGSTSAEGRIDHFSPLPAAAFSRSLRTRSPLRRGASHRLPDRGVPPFRDLPSQSSRRSSLRLASSPRRWATPSPSSSPEGKC